jgi:GT2 family glycosyltransferase
VSPLRERDPAVSIITVAFGGGWCWVPRALEALRRNTTEAYEVILVDNGGVESRPPFDRGNVELIRNESNVGFGPASNQGAARARSDVLVFLNPDVLVEPRWLPPLLARLADQDVGAVFPAKLNLDGTLQDAGAFVTEEANAYLFGYGEAADQPAHAFPRDVDFGSAAAMCLTRARFEAESGFDPVYRFAYYEDTDLCFRLRARGLRLVYEPRSRVFHALSVAAPSAELAAILARNREVFLGRWRKLVEGRPPYELIAADEATRVAARDTHAAPRILLIGGASDSLRQARALALTYPRARVTLLADLIEPLHEAALLESGVEVVQTRLVAEWLRKRPGHYSYVMAGPERHEELRATQRDAILFSSPRELVAALAD